MVSTCLHQLFLHGGSSLTDWRKYGFHSYMIMEYPRSLCCVCVCLSMTGPRMCRYAHVYQFGFPLGVVCGSPTGEGMHSSWCLCASSGYASLSIWACAAHAHGFGFVCFIPSGSPGKDGPWMYEVPNFAFNLISVCVLHVYHLIVLSSKSEKWNQVYGRNDLKRAVHLVLFWTLMYVSNVMSDQYWLIT